MNWQDTPLVAGFYLARHQAYRPQVVEYVTESGAPHWRNANDDRCCDPRDYGYVLTPIDEKAVIQ